jgi:hypothetical protein
MSSVEKWMELEIIMLSKISQAQKDNYHIFSHMQNVIVELWGGCVGQRERKRMMGGENTEVRCVYV